MSLTMFVKLGGWLALDAYTRSAALVRWWFESAGFTNIDVRFGPNGVVGTGTRPADKAPSA
jgi:hypothetical protein